MLTPPIHSTLTQFPNAGFCQPVGPAGKVPAVLNVWTFETPATGGRSVTVPEVPTYVAFVKF